MVEHVDLGNLWAVSIEAVADDHLELLTKFAQLVSICTAFVWGLRMARTSLNVGGSDAGAVIGHIAERGDLNPLWRLVVLLLRLLRRVKNSGRRSLLPSFRWTERSDPARNLFDTIHGLLEFSLLFLLIQKGLEIDEAFVLSCDFGLGSVDLLWEIGAFGSSDALGGSLGNVLVREVGCLQRRESRDDLLESPVR